MTQDDIIRMARDAGLHKMIRVKHVVEKVYEIPSEKLERFAVLVAAHEREACAKECDHWVKQAEERGYTCKGETHIDGFGDGSAACAAAIRARGKNE